MNSSFGIFHEKSFRLTSQVRETFFKEFNLERTSIVNLVLFKTCRDIVVDGKNLHAFIKRFCKVM